MYAIIRRYEGVTSVDEVMRRIDAGWKPIVRSIPDFVAYYAVDAGGGVALSISLFEDQTGAEESARRAAEWIPEHLGSLSPHPPQVIAGQVRVQVAKEGIVA